MEANSLCERLKKDVHFSVTLRIPPERLGPSVEPESRLLCSAAIKLVRPGREDSIWALDKPGLRILRFSRNSFLR